MAILTELDRWGPPLELYLHSQRTLSRCQIDCPTTLEQLQASIAALDDPMSITCSTLEQILSVTSYPHELLALSNIQLTRISFDLLQSYTKSNSLFDYRYGLLCLQVLVLSLQINVLKVDNVLEDFVLDIFETMTCVEISSALSDLATKMLWPRAKKQVAGSIAKIDFPSFYAAKQRCQGGLLDEDIGRIQSWFWHDRRPFFDLCTVVSDTHWVVLFVLFWYKVAQLTKADASRKEYRLWYQLSNLICRYALATPQAKGMQIIGPLSRSIHRELHSQGFIDDDQMRPPAMDLPDSAMFREAAIHRLALGYGPPLNLHMTLTVFRFVGQHDMYALNTAKMELLPYIEAAHTRLWAEIELVEFSSNAGWRADVIMLMRSVFGLASVTLGGAVIVNHKLDAPMMSGKMLDMARQIGKALRKMDWVNLIGRVLLLPVMPYDNKHPSLEAFDEVQEHWSETRQKIELQCDILFKYDQDVLDDFNDNYSDWMKTWNFIKSQRAMWSSHKYLCDYLWECENIWLDVGNSLGFMTRTSLRCAYTGCSSLEALHRAPLNICARCNAKNYCSTACQQRDWRIVAPESHYLECTAGLTRPQLPDNGGPAVYMH